MDSSETTKVKIYIPISNDCFECRREWVSQPPPPGVASKIEVPFYRVNLDAKKFDQFVISMPPYISVLDQNGKAFDPRTINDITHVACRVRAF